MTRTWEDNNACLTQGIIICFARRNPGATALVLFTLLLLFKLPLLLTSRALLELLDERSHHTM